MKPGFALHSLLAFVCCVLFFGSSAQEGNSDQLFGTNGIVWNPPIAQQISNQLRNQNKPITLVQTNGSILLINGVPTNQGVLITRFLPDGLVDGAFGVNGSVTVPVQNSVIQPKDALLLPDDKFLVTGSGQLSPSTTGFGVMKFNADGTPDINFDGDGKIVVSMGADNSSANALTLQADGKIIVTGSVSGKVALLRLLSNGSIDNSFDQDGIVAADFSGSTERGNDVKVQNDGKIVVAGYSYNETIFQGQTIIQQDVALFRYHPDGSVDTGFGNNGVATVITANQEEEATNIAIEPVSENIIISGHQFARIDEDATALVLMRFLPGGTADQSFGTAGTGRITLSIGGRAWGVDLGIQHDGKIIMSGTNLCTGICGSEAVVDINVFRFNQNGTTDVSFTASGKRTIFAEPYQPPNSGTIDIGGSFASQGNKLIVSGLASPSYQNQTKMLLTRLNTTSPLIRDVITLPPVNHVTIPAKIEAEDYTSMNGVLLEGTADDGGGLNVGWQDDNDWMDYNIDVPASGSYPINFRVATMFTGAQFQIKNAAGVLLETITVPNTGGFQNWQTISTNITLPAGRQTVRLFTSHASGGWNINWLQFTQQSNYTLIPAKIEAEDYNSMNGVLLEGTTDAGGGLNVGWQDTGDWMDYNINAPTAGSYPINFRVATEFTGAQFQIKNTAGVVLETITVPNTGGFQNWQTISTTINLPAGDQTIRISTSNAAGGWNLNWLQFTQQSNYTLIPAKIEAEDYNNMNGVLLEGTADEGGGLNVGWQDTGDWMDYNIDAPTAGSYPINFRVATMFTGAQFQIKNSAGVVLETISVPNTGGFQNWQTISGNVNLTAGQHILRVHTNLAAGGWNLNWMEFGQPQDDNLLIPDRVEAEDYTNMSGVQTEATMDSTGNQNLVNIDRNDWMEYKVLSANAGFYRMRFRVASSASETPQFVLTIGTDSITTITVPNTGGFQTWRTLEFFVPIYSAGVKTIRLTSTGGGNWNINWLEFEYVFASFTPIPAQVQAGNTYRRWKVEDAVAIEEGQIVEYLTNIDYGDWMEYRITVPVTGLYKLQTRVASWGINHPAFAITLANERITTVEIPNTGGLDNWQNVEVLVLLTGGSHTLKITSAGGGGLWNFHWLKFDHHTPALPDTVLTKTAFANAETTLAHGVNNKLSVAPNPVRDNFVLSLNNNYEGVFKADIVSVGGAVTKSFSFRKQAGPSLHTLSIGNVANGVYIVRTQMNGRVNATKIIKQ